MIGRKDPDGSTLGWTLVWTSGNGNSHGISSWLGELHYDVQSNKPVIFTTTLRTEKTNLLVYPDFTQPTKVSTDTFQMA